MIQNWHRDEGPCIGLGVEGAFDDIHLWENDRLVYPTVVSIDGEYWMWYGSYSQYGGEEMKTAIGCAYDGALRIWYALRPAPPFEHKYFAIGTAHWPNRPAAAFEVK